MKLFGILPQIALLAVLLFVPSARNGLITSARPVFGPVGMKISFLVMWLLSVRLSTPMLIRSFGDSSMSALTWIGTLSACVLYVFLLGVPSSVIGAVTVLVLSMVASAIGFSGYWRR